MLILKLHLLALVCLGSERCISSSFFDFSKFSRADTVHLWGGSFKHKAGIFLVKAFYLP